MNTIKEEEFDYQTYTRTHPPEVTKIRQGTEARKQRFEAAKKRNTVRIDEDLFEQFQQLVSEESDYEKFINQVLREWLTAQNVKELVREELHQMIQTALISIQPGEQTVHSKRKVVKG